MPRIASSPRDQESPTAQITENTGIRMAVTERDHRPLDGFVSTEDSHSLHSFAFLSRAVARGEAAPTTWQIGPQDERLPGQSFDVPLRVFHDN